MEKYIKKWKQIVHNYIYCTKSKEWQFSKNYLLKFLFLLKDFQNINPNSFHFPREYVLKCFFFFFCKWVVLQKWLQLSDTHFSQVLNKLEKNFFHVL